MHKKLARVAVAALASWLALNANAAKAALCQLSITYDTTYYGHVAYGGGDAYCYLTPLTATRIGGDALPSNYPSSFETYCLDLGNELSTPGWWQSGPLPAVNANANPPWQPDGIFKAAYLYIKYSSESGAAAGAALQLAIWEVLYEPASTGYNVTSGSLRAYGGNLDTTVMADASRYLTGVGTGHNALFWEAYDPKANQDLIGPVPEPATWLSAALLVLPFLASIFVRRAAKAESFAVSHSRPDQHRNARSVS